MALRFKLTPEGDSKAIPVSSPNQKKLAMGRCPASLYSGKLRLMVQAAYGSKRNDLVAEAAGNEYRLNFAGVTLYHGYSSSHGLYTDNAGEYWLFYLSNSGATVRPVTGTCLADVLPLLGASTEEKIVQEGFILATARIGAETTLTVSGAPESDYGSQLDYGWHFTWTGDEASAVLIHANPDWEPAPSLANTWWLSSLWTASLTDNDPNSVLRGNFSTQEAYLKWRFSWTYAIQGSGEVDFSMHESDLVWTRRTSDGLMGIEDFGWSCACLPTPCNGHDCTDAPLYCFYDENDDLSVVEYSKTTHTTSIETTTGGNDTSSSTNWCGCVDRCWWQKSKSGAKTTRSLAIDNAGVEHSVEANATLRIVFRSTKHQTQDSSPGDECSTSGGWRIYSSAASCGESFPPSCGSALSNWAWLDPVYTRQTYPDIRGYNSAALALIVPWGDCSAVYVGHDQYANLSSYSYNVYISGINCPTTSCNPNNYCQYMLASHYQYSGALCNCGAPGCIVPPTVPIVCCDTVGSTSGKCWEVSAAYDKCMHVWASPFPSCDEPGSILGYQDKRAYQINWTTIATIPGYPGAVYWDTEVTLVGLKGAVGSIPSNAASSGTLMNDSATYASLADCGSPKGGGGYEYGGSRWTGSWNEIFAPGTAVCIGELPDGSRMEVWQSVQGAIQYIVSPDYTDAVDGFDTVDWESRFVGWT